jgi:hypothetical protein
MIDLNTIMVILAIVASFLFGARTGYIKGFSKGSDWVIEELKQRRRGEDINGNKSDRHDKQKTGR